MTRQIGEIADVALRKLHANSEGYIKDIVTGPSHTVARGQHTR